MDANDRLRLESYLRDQNFFRGAADQAGERATLAFVERTMPWLIDQIADAVQAAWSMVRRRMAW